MNLFQVRGIETVTTYDKNTGEFVINTPCESAQKYWIGGAANVRTVSCIFKILVPFNTFYFWNFTVYISLSAADLFTDILQFNSMFSMQHTR